MLRFLIPFLKLTVYERVGISLVEVYDRVGNMSCQPVERPKRVLQTHFMAVKKVDKTF